MSEWFDVGHADDFAEGEVAAARAGSQAVAVFRLGEEIFALKDLCTHGNAKLSDGYVEDGCVECPLHQGLFDIRSGAPRSAPVTEAVRTFPIRVVAGRVEVEITGGSSEPGAATCKDCTAQAASPVRIEATVAALTRAAEDVIILQLDHAGGTALPYRAGQYLDVLLDNGQRRSYSMATPPMPARLELHVRHLKGGLFTDHVFGMLKPGDRLELEGPGGSFWLREGSAPVVLLASGTGFAPIKAIVEQAIADGTSRPMVLYWGGRTSADLYQHARCLDWAATLPWFTYVPVLSEAVIEDRWEGRCGLVHQAVMADLPDLSGHQVYACGAPVMVEAARVDFTGRCALPPSAFFADAFLSRSDLSSRR